MGIKLTYPILSVWVPGRDTFPDSPHSPWTVPAIRKAAVFIRSFHSVSSKTKLLNETVHFPLLTFEIGGNVAFWLYFPSSVINDQKSTCHSLAIWLWCTTMVTLKAIILMELRISSRYRCSLLSWIFGKFCMQWIASWLLCLCLWFDMPACGSLEHFQWAQQSCVLLGQRKDLAFEPRQASTPMKKFIRYILFKCGKTIHNSYQCLFRLWGREWNEVIFLCSFSNS